MSRRARLTWLAAAVVVVAGGAFGWRALSGARAPSAAKPAAAASAPVEAGIELAATDVVAARSLELSQGLAITGSLRAVNSALVKARVAGELQGLSVREGDAVRAGQVIATGLKQAGIQTKQVGYTQGQSDLTAPLTAAGASTADFIAPYGTASDCANQAKALQQLAQQILSSISPQPARHLPPMRSR